MLYLTVVFIIGCVTYFVCWAKVYRSATDESWFLLLIPIWFLFPDRFQEECLLYCRIATISFLVMLVTVVLLIL